ncbi:hypothetical protein INT43_002616 [Umbelopsis isabellina]|uniref:Uncharacterized protein n=1 Tax=Mortierella isabellina TaxID=91625 RepID=A0A8H7Q6I6_MORIS|nr:hypothetical protein INT43_002616 [Umbelopsis isabellina]
MPSNNRNEPDNELDLFEALAAQVFGGTFSILQDVMQGGSGQIHLGTDLPTQGPPVWDDGQDFRKLVKNSRNREEATATDNENTQHLTRDEKPGSLHVFIDQSEQNRIPQPVSIRQKPTSLLDLLFENHLGFHNKDESTIIDDSQSGTVLMLEDGSQETVTTKSINGLTETYKKVVRPDGTIVETVEPKQNPLDWTRPLKQLEDKVNQAWEDSQPEREQTLVELDRAATSLGKAYTGIREGIFSRLWNAFADDKPPNDK